MGISKREYLAEQISSTNALGVSATSITIAQERTGAAERQQFIITNTSAAQVVTIVKGSAAAIAGQGIILQPNGSYGESTDGGFVCWQGEMQAVATGAGTVSIVETFIIL
jgi:hypothetical protein